MTDPVDELLRRAGESWRSAQPEPPEPDPSRWSQPDAPRRRLPALAAAGVTAAVVAGVVSVVAYRSDHSGPPADGRVGIADQLYVSAAAATSALVVHDGDQVRASGMVLIRTGQDTRFCAPAVSAGVALSGSGDGPPCEYSVPVTGVDAARLSSVQTVGQSRFGYADLQGQWRDGRLEVIRQAPAAAPPPVPALTIPCAPPPSAGRPRRVRTARHCTSTS